MASQSHAHALNPFHELSSLLTDVNRYLNIAHKSFDNLLYNYLEWISRERIAENLSLRENYQSKAQGKGPGAPPSSHMGDEDKGGKGKKRGRSVTPSAPTPPPTSSSTGTRSKTASAAANAPSPTPSNSSSVKRKRLSTSERSTASDEPVTATAVGKKKTKRSYKKGEKSGKFTKFK